MFSVAGARRRIALALLTIAVIGWACGDDEGDSRSSTTPTAPPATQTPEARPEVTIVAIVKDVARSARLITLSEPVQGFESVAVTGATIIWNESGASISLSNIEPGVRIEASGQPGESNALLAKKIRVLAGEEPGPGISIPSEPLQGGDPAPLPADIALIIETGCTQCDGPTTGLLRAYLDPAGQPRSDELISIQSLGLPARMEPNPKEPSGFITQEPYITGFALNSNAADTAVSVCTRGYCGGLGSASPDAQATLFLSQDGGVTWQKGETLDGGYGVAALANDQIVMFSYAENAVPGAGYVLYPGLDPLQPPPGINEYSRPILLPMDRIVWNTPDGRLLYSDGTPFLALPPSVTERLMFFVPSENLEQLLVGWIQQDAGQGSESYRVGLLGPDGQISKAYRTDTYLAIGGWLDPQHAIGDVWGGWLKLPAPTLEYYGDFPVVVDVETGIVHLIDGLPLPRGRNNVRAVIHGPFARVVNTGSCLNVRAQAGDGADVITCAADGVLLRDLGETKSIAAETWQRVAAPDGSEGWAIRTYLDR